MRRSLAPKLAAAVLAAWMAQEAAAQAEGAPDAATPAAATESPGRLRLGVGIDRRLVWEYFYFYPSAYAETDGSTFGVAVEGAYAVISKERFDLALGVGLALGSGSADFFTPGPTQVEEDLFTVHAEAFGEAGFRLVPQLALLGRLGFGYTGVMHDSADEGFTNLLLGLGARFDLSRRLGIAVLYEFAVANIGGTTDAGVTSAEPSLEDHDNAAIQVRVVFSL